MRTVRIGTTLLAVALAVGATACGDDTTEPDELDAPTGVTVTQLSLTSVRIGWTAVTGADNYVVERASAASPGVFNLVSDTVTGTQYDDTGLTAGVAYSYRVSAEAGTLSSDPSTVVTVTTGVAAATINANITANRTLYTDTVYTLSGYVKVTNGATLTIQPGTKIVGDAATPGSSLWITRGAKIDAQGTAAEPIVFTSAKPAGQRKPGDWGGLIIIGNGIINRTANPVLTEGPGGAAENYAGGADNADNSGTLRYVRIEFAGFDVSNGGGQELNSLSSYAVGSGTTYEYVQSMSGLDDSFEFWGGAVKGKYLISYESGDDHFDWSEGFVGTLQYLIAFQSQVLVPAPGTGTTSGDPRGFEADGCDPGLADCTVTANGTNTPYSKPTVANFTLVGWSNPAESVGSGDVTGIFLRRGTGGFLFNGIVTRWRGLGCSMRDAWTDSLRLRDSLDITNVLFAQNEGGSYDVGSNFCLQANWAANHHLTTGETTQQLLTSVNTASLDFSPVAGSSADTMAVSIQIPVARRGPNNYIDQATFVGASDGTKWWEGWSVYVIN
jgi:hypothetical protein